MKPRKWVIVVACIALIMGSVLLGAIGFLEKSGNIERLLVQTISASTGNEFSVERVKFGFLSVYLENVSITLASHFYRLDIHDIKVGFSLKNLIRYRGNVGRSISNMILIHPDLGIFINSHAASMTDTAAASPANVDIFSALRHLPVDQFLVRDGTVRLIEKGAEGFTVGEELAGSIKARTQGVSFDVRGSLAARRKNLFISGFLSKDGRQTRISLRLDKARVQKTIRLNGIELRSGVLDGVCEFSLPDSMKSETMEAGGWIHLRDATAIVGDIDKPVTALTVSVTLVNTICKIDSVKGVWNGISCKGAGAWNLASDDDSASTIILQCQGIRSEFLLPKTAKSAFNVVRGSGWVIARLSKKRASAGTSVSLTAGGISVAGIPVLASARALLERNQCTIDSCDIRGAEIRASCTGIVNYEKSPMAYTFAYTLKADSLPRLSALRGSGRFHMHGSVHGLGPKPDFEATLGGSRMRCFGIPLGDPEITVTGDDINHIRFDCPQNIDAFFRASGTLDSLTGKSPNVNARIAVGPAILRGILERSVPRIARAVDSPSVSGFFSGNAEQFEASGQAGLHSPIIHGTLQFKVSKNKNNAFASFRVMHRELYAGDSAVSLAATGTIHDNAFSIDSLSALGAVRGSGHFDGKAGAAMELTIKYRDLPLGALNTWFYNRRLPIKSGEVTGISRIYGMHGRISTESEVHVRECSLAAIDGVDADFVIMSKDTVFTLMPAIIRKDGVPIISLDTLRNGPDGRFSGSFKNVRLNTVLEGSIPEEYLSGDNEVKAALSGVFYSGKSMLPIHLRMGCPAITMNCWRLDSMQADVDMDELGIHVNQLSVSDSNRARVTCNGNMPWTAVIGGRGDSATNDAMDVRMRISGDIAASFEKNISRPFHVPVAGNAKGVIEIEFRGVGGSLQLYKIEGFIPRGALNVKPYVTRTINDFSCAITMNGSPPVLELDNAFAAPQVTIDVNGTIDKRPIRIYTSHKIPEGLEPLRFGFLNAGVVHVVTPRRGVDLHIPGLMEPGVTGDIEFVPKGSLPAFTLSGPLDRLRITGTWILRNGEFTFPPLKNGETTLIFDPFPVITWDFDVKAANRKIKYFFDTGTKTRRLMRLVECYVDPISVLSLRGRDDDHTFKILGSLRSYKGSVFFRRVFDQNFEAGLDFLPQPLAGGKGFDNLPIIWGSAEGLSEKNRFDRIKLTLITRDSVSGAVSEKGRFHDIRFKVSSDAEETPGESEAAFLKTEGKRVASVEGAGELVSTLGEQYVHRFLLQNLEGRLAKSLGLDVITFETSIASNYFNKIYNRQLVNFTNDWSYLAFANVGVTFGRYILYDKVFLKWRTELVPVDTLIKPEYTMGFEFQPLNYFMMDFDYGVRPGEKFLEQNPKVQLQLRLPIESMRKYFKF